MFDLSAMRSALPPHARARAEIKSNLLTTRQPRSQATGHGKQQDEQPTSAALASRTREPPRRTRTTVARRSTPRKRESGRGTPTNHGETPGCPQAGRYRRTTRTDGWRRGQRHSSPYCQIARRGLEES